MRKLVPLIVLGVLVSCGGEEDVPEGSSSSESMNVLEAAYAACGPESMSKTPARVYVSERMLLGDDGTSLSIDGDGSDDVDLGDDNWVDNSTAMDMQEACAIDAVGVPDYVITQIEQTSALMGRQTAEWENVEAAWTYHPDNGLDITFVLV